MSNDPRSDAPTAHHDAPIELPTATPIGKRRGTLIIVVALAVIGAAFVVGLVPRLVQKRAVAHDTAAAAEARPRLEVVTPKPITSDRALELPATIMPLEETTVYPRAAGYVRRWLVDIGDQVKEGQLLAEIDTPELDAQLEQARADLAQAEAAKLRAETNAELSKTERSRYEVLAPAGVASSQELEQRRAQAKVDEANIKVASATITSQQANLRRLTQLKSFARVLAPFGGTITSRTIDRGALVAAGNATPLFKLAASDPVRVFVQVPQDVAPSIRTGVPATLIVREYGNRRFEGTVSRAAGELDATTRTMTTEVRIANPKHELLPGMYARCALTLPTPHRLFEIPATALYNDAQGTRVAVLDAQNHVALKKIAIERDTGQTLEVATGLDGSERLVRIANAALSEGTIVDVIATAK